MRALWMLGIWAAVGTPLPAQTKIDQRIAASPDVSLRIFNLTGSIRVSGWDRDSIWVTGTVAPGGGAFYLAGGASGAKLVVEQPGEKPDMPPTTLDVRVPVRSRVWIKAASATVTVTGVTGSLDISTVSGAVRIDGTLSQIMVESMDGDITIGGSALWLRAKSASGAVTFAGRSDDLGMSTVSGPMIVQGDRFQRCQLSSVTADIRFGGGLTPDATCQFESHSGTVELVLPADVSADFELSTLRGTIANPFGRGQAAVRTSVRGQEATFVVGKGEARVVVRNFKGNVVLKENVAPKKK